LLFFACALFFSVFALFLSIEKIDQGMKLNVYNLTENKEAFFQKDIPGFNFLLGNFFLKERRLKEAVECYKKEIIISGLHPSYFGNIALAIEPRLCLEYACTAVFLAPFSNDLRLNLSELLLKNSMYDQALFNIDQVYVTDIHSIRARDIAIRIREKLLNNLKSGNQSMQIQLQALYSIYDDMLTAAFRIVKERDLTDNEKKLITESIKKYIKSLIMQKNIKRSREVLETGLALCGMNDEFLKLVKALGGTIKK
jgi:tetratricopeptide (TPR) repeat protein